MKSKTYAGWREIGYQVIRGEKASGRDKAGVPTFTRDQVEEVDRFDRPAPGQRQYNPDPTNENEDR